MRLSLAAAAIALSLLPAIASAQTTESAAPPTFSTTTSTIGDILANPDAKAVLVKDVPEIVTDQLSRASSLTLDNLKQYVPDKLTPEVLAQIDADFAKIPAK